MSCASDACDCKQYTSQVETSILNSCDPISVVESEQINVNGEIGIWVNKNETENFTGPVPINQYPINKDPVPQVIHKKPRCVECHRDVTIKYLEPPPIPSPGPIVINQAQNILAPAAPPVIIRQVPCKPIDPEPLVVREIPPAPPQPPAEKVITIPGELLPPPPRKVVIERLPELPEKPQDVHIERWLPFKDIKRQIILNPKPSDPVQCKPRNIIINWEKRNCCHINTDIINLGVEKTDPLVYMQTHGATLQHESEMPEICEEVKREHGIPLAVDQCENSFYKELEGDIHALKLIDLDAEGLSDYKKYLNSNCNHCNHCSKCNPSHIDPSSHHSNHISSSPELLQSASQLAKSIELQPTSSDPEPIQASENLVEVTASSLPVLETLAAPVSLSTTSLSSEIAVEEKPASPTPLSPEPVASQPNYETQEPVVEKQEAPLANDEKSLQVASSAIETFQPVEFSFTVPQEEVKHHIPFSVEDSAFDESSIADVTVATEFTVQSCTIQEKPEEQIEEIVTTQTSPNQEKLAEETLPAQTETITSVTASVVVEQLVEAVSTSPATTQDSSPVETTTTPVETSESPAQETLTDVTPEIQQESPILKDLSNNSQVEDLGNYSLVVETPAATFEHSIIVESSQLEQTIVTDHGLEETTHNDISIIEESVHESLFEEASIVDDHEPVVNEYSKSILQDELSIITEHSSISSSTEDDHHVVNID